MDYIPDLATLTQFAVATFVIAITPGPDMTLFVGRALSQGKMAGLACMLGACTGILIHTAMVAIGLSALIVASPSAFWVIKIAGAAYLVYLAYQAIRYGSTFSPDATPRPPKSFAQNWMAGLGINLMNPKIIIFFMTFLPQFVSAHDPHAPGKLVFLGVFFILFSAIFTVPMILAADQFSAALKRSPKATRVLDWLLAGVFSAFAVKIITAQAK